MGYFVIIFYAKETKQNKSYKRCSMQFITNASIAYITTDEEDFRSLNSSVMFTDINSIAILLQYSFQK